MIGVFGYWIAAYGHQVEPFEVSRGSMYGHMNPGRSPTKYVWIECCG